MKPYSESCDQNKSPILEVLREAFAISRRVLEIGSGTGQHAVYFARQLPHLEWHTSDRMENIAGIRQWLADEPSPNLFAPYILDVAQAEWPAGEWDGVFSANTTHIMHWPEVISMFAGIGRLLQEQGLFCLYGPFNYHGEYTSESNQRFDQWLKDRDPLSGLRDVDALLAEGRLAGLELIRDIAMPANNRVLVWQKLRRED